MTFKTKNRRGQTGKKITVNSNDPESPKLELEVTATLTIKLDAKNPQVYFGRVEKKQPVTKKVEIVGELLDKAKITGIEIPGEMADAFTTKIQDTLIDGKRDLAVDITMNGAKQKPGNFSATMKITTNVPEKPEIIVTLRGQLMGPISVKPERVYFVNYKPEEPQTRTIMISGTEGEPFKILSAEINGQPAYIDIKGVSGKSSASHELSLTLTPPSSDRVNHTMVVKTSHPEQPELEIQVFGYKYRERKAPAEKPKGKREPLPDRTLKGSKETELK